MRDNRRGWTGSSWSVLPFESCFSVCTRFAWLNALDRAQLDHLGVLAQVKRACTFLAHETRMARNLQRALQRPLSLPVKHTLFESSAIGLLGSLFSSSLRFCPLCLEVGYHAFWHQCRPLLLCPIHGTVLMEQCMTCAKPLPPFGDAALYARPYACTGCGHPYCGADFTIGAHLDFRLHADLLTERFSDISQWFEQLDRRLNWAFFRDDESERYWAARWRLAYDFCGSIVSPPAECMLVEDRGIVMWHWANAPAREAYHAQGFVNRRESDRVQKAYRSTLLLLKTWLHNRAVARRDTGASRRTLRIGQEGAIELQGDTYELAYLLLRCVLSDDAFAGNIRRLTDDTAGASPGPALAWFVPSFDIPCLALHMVFLWLYTKMMEFVATHTAQCVVSFFEIQDFLGRCDSPVLLGNTQHVRQGMIIFRSMPDMLLP